MNLNESYEDVYKEIYELAASKHAGQKRKKTGADYITHPDGVAKILDAYGADDDLVTCGLMHDTLEDTDINWAEIYEKCGERVADIVSELTNNNNEIERLKSFYNGSKVEAKKAYMNKHLLELSSDALVVKLADFVSNISDSPGVDQKSRMIANMQYLQKHRRLNTIQSELLSTFFSLARASS